MSTDVQPREPLRLPGWLKFIVVFLLVVGLIASFIWLMGAAATRRWEQFAADLRAKGQPVTFAEIEAQRTVIPDEINSAKIIEALADELNKLGAPPIDKWVLTFGSRRHGGYGERRAALRAECLDQVSGPARRHTRTPPANHAHARGAILRRLFSARNTNPCSRTCRGSARRGKLVHLDTLLAAADHRAANAVDNVVLQLRLADTLAEEPTLISRLVQIALEGVALAIARSGIAGGRADRNGRASACKPKSTSG